MRVRTSGACSGGPLIRHRLRRCHLPPTGGKATPKAAHREIGGFHHGPRTAIAPLRRQPWEPPTPQYLHTSGSTNGGAASPDPHKPVTPPPRIPRKKRGYIGGNPLCVSFGSFLHEQKGMPPAGRTPAPQQHRGIPKGALPFSKPNSPHW